MTPIFVSGYGRSGTTAIMALLGSNPAVAYDRVYPFEHRSLTYLAKMALVASRRYHGTPDDAVRMCDADEVTLGSPPWWPNHENLAYLSAETWLAHLWAGFVRRIKDRFPEATHYAEKVPHWVPDYWRSVAPSRVIHLVRDPRDMYLSARNFAKSRGQATFGVVDRVNENETARDMAHKLVSFAETERADRGKAESILVRYEDWATDRHAVARRISDWLGLKLDSDAKALTSHLDQHRTTKSVAASVGRWRSEQLPAEVNSHLLPALGTYGRDYGYDLSEGTSDVVPDPAWTHSADGVWKCSPLGSNIEIRGPDTWMELRCEPFAAKRVTEVWLCLRATYGELNSVYWCRGDEEFDESRAIHLPFRTGPEIQIIRFPVGKHESWNDTVRRLRVDICNGGVKKGAEATVSWVRLVP